MFEKLSVAFRVYGAFGVLIILLVLSGSAAIFGVNHVSGLFESYRHAARQTLEINDYARDLSEAQRLSLAYRLNPSAQIAEYLLVMVGDAATNDAEGWALLRDDEAGREGGASIGTRTTPCKPGDEVANEGPQGT